MRIPIFAAASFVLLAAIAHAEGTKSTPFLHNGVTAHRGDSGNFPENTMAAIESALKLGVDWIEIDVFETADGHLVVTHDATTKRVAERDLVVAESTLAELQALDVATGFRTERNLDTKACPPAVMPTLRAVLERILQQRKTRLSIQPKADVVDGSIALVRELKAESWVGFNDGDLNKMRRVKELAPEIHVFWDRFKESPLEDEIATAKALGFESLVPHVQALTSERVKLMQKAGFEVGAWTVNDAKTMAYLLDMGVDRTYTDYPRRLFAVKAGR